MVKSVRHFRLQNEREVLLRFQNRTPFIRPLIDEIEASSISPAIILRYLDDDVLHASNTQRLSRLEVKYVAKRVLEALSVLHNEGFVHTGIHPPVWDSDLHRLKLTRMDNRYKTQQCLGELWCW